MNCTKLSTFCGRLEKQAYLTPDRFDPNKYKGDGFELLCERLIKLSPIDNRIGIGRYSPIQGLDVGGIDTIAVSTSLVAPQSWIDQNSQLYSLLLLERDNIQKSLQ